LHAHEHPPARRPPIRVGRRGLALLGAAFAIFLFQPAACRAAGRTNTAADAVVHRIGFVTIPGGSFRMGLAPSDPDAFQSLYPPRTVRVHSFIISRAPITFAQYDSFARSTGRALPDDSCWGRGERPVINVSWRDVQAFISWLNLTGHHFRLPTEAEYEYAARGGTTTRYWWGESLDPSKANTSIDAPPDVWQHTSPVGAFPANPFGLVDIVGNVWEWTSTCFAGHGDCFVRVIRGGGWESISRGVRTTTRGAAPQSARSNGLGFRIVEEAP
jgi:formylglycine-generating enzyme required for sulfatase activity